MSLYSKYQELGLRDESLLSWLPVSGGSLLSDLGPNGNDWTTISGSVVDNTGYFTNSGALIQVNDSSQVVFAGLNFKRFANNTSVVFHNYSGGAGDFVFGVLPSDQFFVGRPTDSGCGIFIFDDLVNLPSQGLFTFSKSFNDFTVSCFDYDAGRTIVQTLSLPLGVLDYSSNPLLMGGTDIPGFNESNLEIHEAFVMDRKTPDHIGSQLYSEVNGGSGNYNQQISVFDNNQEFSYEPTSGDKVHRSNSNFIPRWSSSPSGFSINGTSLEASSRLFVNGSDTSFSESERILSFTDMVAEDACIYDSYENSSFVASAPTGVSGANFVAAEVNPFGEIVYNSNLERLNPYSLDYLSVGDSSPIFGREAYAYNKQNIYTALGTGDIQTS